MMEERKSRTRIGVSVNFLAMIAWLSVIGGEWIPFLVAGAILVLEKDGWLKKQMIKVLVLAVAVRVGNYLLFTHLIDLIFPQWYLNAGVLILKIIVYLAEDALWIVLALRAWKRTPSYTSLDHFAEGCLETEYISGTSTDTEMTGSKTPTVSVASANVCPNCGKLISDEMDFCVNCGTKVR